MIEKETFSYDEVVNILQSGKSDVHYFVVSDKNIHVCFANDQSIKWAWGSQSYFRTAESFNESQKNFMFHTRFVKEYSSII